MESLSNLAESVETHEPETPPRRPRPFRHGVHRLAYVNLDHANGGIIRNLSETGIALQAVRPFPVNEPVHRRFALVSPRVRGEDLGPGRWAYRFRPAGGDAPQLPERAQAVLPGR